MTSWEFKSKKGRKQIRFKGIVILSESAYLANRKGFHPADALNAVLDENLKERRKAIALIDKIRDDLKRK